MELINNNKRNNLLSKLRLADQNKTLNGAQEMFAKHQLENSVFFVCARVLF